MANKYDIPCGLKSGWGLELQNGYQFLFALGPGYLFRLRSRVSTFGPSHEELWVYWADFVQVSIVQFKQDSHEASFSPQLLQIVLAICQNNFPKLCCFWNTNDFIIRRPTIGMLPPKTPVTLRMFDLSLMGQSRDSLTRSRLGTVFQHNFGTTQQPLDLLTEVKD